MLWFFSSLGEQIFFFKEEKNWEKTFECSSHKHLSEDIWVAFQAKILTITANFHFLNIPLIARKLWSKLLLRELGRVGKHSLKTRPNSTTRHLLSWQILQGENFELSKLLYTFMLAEKLHPPPQNAAPFLQQKNPRRWRPFSEKKISQVTAGPCCYIVIVVRSCTKLYEAALH